MFCYTKSEKNLMDIIIPSDCVYILNGRMLYVIRAQNVLARTLTGVIYDDEKGARRAKFSASSGFGKYVLDHFDEMEKLIKNGRNAMYTEVARNMAHAEISKHASGGSSRHGNPTQAKVHKYNCERMKEFTAIAICDSANARRVKP